MTLGGKVVLLSSLKRRRTMSTPLSGEESQVLFLVVLD